MAESFLEEQVRRIKRLTDEMTEIENRAAELSKELSRERELIRKGPLNEIRDYRTFDSHAGHASATSRDSHSDRFRKPLKAAHASSSRRRHR